MHNEYCLLGIKDIVDAWCAIFCINTKSEAERVIYA